jgi:Predicted permease.
MNYLRRALARIVRCRGQTLVIFILIFILGNVSAANISFLVATQNVEQNLEKQIPAIATIKIDFQMLISNDNEQDISSLATLEQLDKIAALPYVKLFDYTRNTFVYTDIERSDGVSGPSYLGGNHLKLSGVSYSDVQKKAIFDTEVGLIDLIAGRTFTTEEITNGVSVGLISEEVAQINNLKIGDSVPMRKIVYNYALDNHQHGAPTIFAQRAFEIEIIGIFKPKLQEFGMGSEKRDLGSLQNIEGQNQLYVPIQVAAAEDAFHQEKVSEMFKQENIDAPLFSGYTPIFLLNSINDMEKFQAEAQQFLPEYCRIEAGIDSYNQLASPIISLQAEARKSSLISLLITTLILTLIIIVVTYRRRRELNIYLILGEQRRNIATQINLEIIIVTLAAISIALISGNIQAAITNEAVRKEIQQQAWLENSATSDNSEIFYKYGAIVSKEEMASAYGVELNLPYIITGYIANLGIIFVAVVSATIYILLRLNPKKVLV